eukprot:sb/3479243/
MEPNETSKQPIRTSYLGHVTTKISKLFRRKGVSIVAPLQRGEGTSLSQLSMAPGEREVIVLHLTIDHINTGGYMEPNETSKQPIRTSYLGHVTS